MCEIQTIFKQIDNVFDAIEMSAILLGADLRDRVQKVATAIFDSCQQIANCAYETLNHWYQRIKEECHEAGADIVSLFILPSRVNFSDAEIASLKTEATSQMQAINTEGVSTATNIKLGELDGVSLTRKREDNVEGKSLVYFLGNNELWYSALPLLLEMHEETGADVYCYNYRGTGESTGCLLNEEALVEDGKKIVLDLLTKGVMANRLFLYGSDSFGGMCATLIASQFAKEGIFLDLGSERSSGDFSELIKKTVSFFGGFFVSIATNFGWKFNVQEALKTLQSHLIVIENPQDSFVTSPISFKTALDATAPLTLKKITHIQMNDQEFYAELPEEKRHVTFNPHTRPFSKRERRELYNAIKDQWTIKN